MIHTNSFAQTNGEVLPSRVPETIGKLFCFLGKWSPGRVAMHHARYAGDKNESGLYNPNSVIGDFLRDAFFSTSILCDLPFTREENLNSE